MHIRLLKKLPFFPLYCSAYIEGGFQGLPTVRDALGKRRHHLNIRGTVSTPPGSPVEPDSTETLTAEPRKETPSTVNESTNTHVHRPVQHKHTFALCASDPSTLPFTEDEKHHEQKTARSRLATTGKVANQGSLWVQVINASLNHHGESLHGKRQHS